jgi:hypothetical protein
VVVADIDTVTFLKKNTDFEVLLHAGLLRRDLQNARDRPSLYFQRKGRHPDSNSGGAWKNSRFGYFRMGTVSFMDMVTRGHW